MPGCIAKLKICDDISTRRVSDDARPSARPAKASKNDIAEQDTDWVMHFSVKINRKNSL